MPEVTLSLPAALGLLALFLAIGAVMVYLALRTTNSQALAEPSVSPTITLTATATVTPTPPTPTVTSTPEPTLTPLVYTVKLNDTCGGIAYAFKVSVNSIVLMNNLPADCSTLYENQKLSIPQPTPTATPQPSATLNPAEATMAACKKIPYVVQENDTLSKIAASYQVPVPAIQQFNGLVNEVVRFGQKLEIPLCMQAATPGPTPTPTLPPPYPPANLLLPPDGAPFTLSDSNVTLQWAAVGDLRQNEKYQVTVEDITIGQDRKLVDYVNDTKYIVPTSFRPNEAISHIIRWYVMPVRQVGTDNEGNPIWSSAGAASAPRVFSWIGTPGGSTPTP
jgi:LysM repeat protein